MKSEDSQKQSQLQRKKKINIEKFTHKDYVKAVENKCDIVVIIDPQRFRDEFIEEVEDFLDKLTQFQNLVQGRKVKIFQMDIKNQKEMEEISKKYEIKFENDSILLLQNRYMSSFFVVGPYDFFENKDYILKYFKKLSKLNTKIWDEFSKHINQITSDQIFLIGYADKKSDQNYKNLVKKFGILQMYRDYSENKNIFPILINDAEVAAKFGLKDSDSLHVLVKTSKVARNQSNLDINGHKFLVKESCKISDKLIDQINKNSEIFNNEISTFITRGFDYQNYNYTLVLELDKNKIQKQDYKRLLNTFGQLKEELQKDEKNKDIGFFLSKKNKTKQEDDDLFSIILKDDINGMLQTKLYQAFSNQSVQDILEKYKKDNQKDENQEVVDLAKRSFIYKFKYTDIVDINVENIKKWIDEVKAKKVEDYYKSQKPQKYEKYSKKLVSSNFKPNILDNNIDQVVFFYSKFCHACKYYGPVYEQLAKKNIEEKENSQIQFSRIDSDQNQLRFSDNYPYTPVFVYYKKFAKDFPIIYKNEKFTPQLLEDFIKINNQFEIIDESSVVQQVESKKKYDVLMDSSF